VSAWVDLALADARATLTTTTIPRGARWRGSPTPARAAAGRGRRWS
jgi:hypothetical protein